MHDIEPWAYLRDVLCLLPGWSPHRALELAPAYWRQTVALDDVRQLLDANPYRSLTLDHGEPPRAASLASTVNNAICRTRTFRVLGQCDKAHRAATGGAGEHVERERSAE